jgi:hypothetical protein
MKSLGPVLPAWVTPPAGSLWLKFKFPQPLEQRSLTVTNRRQSVFLAHVYIFSVTYMWTQRNVSWLAIWYVLVCIGWAEKKSQVQNGYVLHSIGMYCYQNPQYGQIRTKHIHNHVNTRKYIPKYGQIRTQYIPIPPVLAGNPCAKRSINTYQNIPNTYQFVQIHTKIHTNTGYS